MTSAPGVLFGRLLSRPLHVPRPWKRSRPHPGELSLAVGVNVEDASLSFSGDGIETAVDDFRRFLDAQAISLSNKGVSLRFLPLKGNDRGRYRISISRRGITISADGPQGIRRGLFWLEDEIQGREGPFLPLGQREWREVIHTRISRCFYGPINRPPLHKNELADEIDYYPEEYLNRLAHDGVTALWITIKFRHSVPSRIIPEFGGDSKRDLAKLRSTVARCLRYGIKVYVFCIEPLALPANSPFFERHPDLKGATFSGLAAFCTQSEVGRSYVEEAAASLFEHVPGLGGMIVIPVGEYFTHCASVFPAVLEKCPRCAGIGRDQVLSGVLAAFRRGMDKVDPSAELIAWPYAQLICWGAEGMIESASHIPPGVILQHNYESGGIAMQLGKPRPLWDYWLSWAGISPVFAQAARRTRQRMGRVSAKLQVGTSHENATVPFIPVPGLLYRKYRALHRLGVTSVMQSWYFGNYPSMMTRAAGLLSFAPLPQSENEFLRELARKEWGGAAGQVAKAWACFGKAYENFPATHVFSYYGPVQDGVIWPIYLKPRRAALAPTWQTDYPVSGDYIPHCFSHFFTLSEIVTLCSRMKRGWQQGCRYLDKAFHASVGSESQTHEWRIAHAIRLQFETAHAILLFYSLREKLVDESVPSQRLNFLRQMEGIIDEEISRRQSFIPLLRQEKTLGYHSEAEGFKITIGKVESSIRQLRSLLKSEFPEFRKMARTSNGGWFSVYSGRDTGQLPYFVMEQHQRRSAAFDWAAGEVHPVRYWLLPGQRKAVLGDRPKPGPVSRFLPIKAAFQAIEDERYFHLRIGVDDPSFICREWEPSIEVLIEPSRMQPRVKYILNADGYCRGIYEEGNFTPDPELQGTWQIDADKRNAILRISKRSIALAGGRKPFRMNVALHFSNRSTGEQKELSWTRREPIKARLIWDDINPATDLGWAFRSKKS